MKIIFVNEFAHPESNSTGLFVSQIYTLVKSEGYDVYTVSVDGDYASPGANQSIVRLPLRRRLKKIRPVYWFLISIRLGLKAYRISCRGDVLVVGSNPVFLPLLIRLLAVFYRRRIKVLLLFDTFPLNAIVTSQLKPESKFTLVMLWLYNEAYSTFNAIVVNGRDCVEVIKKWGKCADSNVIYIPHFLLDENVTKPTSRSSATTDMAEVSMQYFGNSGPMQDLARYAPELIKLLCELAHLHLIMIGNAETAVKPTALPASVSLRLKTSPGVTFEERHLALSRSDYGLVTLAPGMYGLAVPSKAWFAVAAGQGLVVFGDKGSELDLVLADYPQLGVFIEADRLDGAAYKIQSFLGRDRQDHENRRRLGLKFIQSCEQEARLAYIKLFKNLTSPQQYEIRK